MMLRYLLAASIVLITAIPPAGAEMRDGTIADMRATFQHPVTTSTNPLIESGLELRHSGHETCLAQRELVFVMQRGDDSNAIELCGVSDGEMLGAVQLLGGYRVNGKLVATPWTDANCHTTREGYACSYGGVRVTWE